MNQENQIFDTIIIGSGPAGLTAAIYNIRAALKTLVLAGNQPGIDSIVSLLIIPIILFFIDFKVFIAQTSFILIYYFIDRYTTQRYIYLRNLQNARVEAYFATLHTSNDVELEEKQFIRVIKKMCNWGFIEWFTLQNFQRLFYSIILVYLIYSIKYGEKNISDLLLITGYLTSTITHINSLSTLKDRLADVTVALIRLVKNKTISTLNMDDLIR